MAESCTSPCGSAMTAVELEGVRDTAFYGGVEAHMVRCEGCGYRRFEPVPTPQMLSTFYDDSYWTPEQARKTADNYFAVDWTHVQTEYERVLARYGRRTESPRFHDFGCAFGATVRHLQLKGWRASGSDLSHNAIELGAELGVENLKTLSLEEFAAEGSDPLDMIWLSHALEHFIDPLAALKGFRERLAQQGVILVRVPNGLYSRAVRRRAGEDIWWYYPAHIHYFTPAGLRCLANRAGLKLVECKAMVRDEEPSAMTASLFGRGWRAWPNPDAFIAGLAANGISAELQAAFVRDDSAATPDPGLDLLMKKLNGERFWPETSPVPPSANQRLTSPPRDGSIAFFTTTAADAAERPCQPEHKADYVYDDRGTAITRAWLRLGRGATLIARPHRQRLAPYRLRAEFIIGGPAFEAPLELEVKVGSRTLQHLRFAPCERAHVDVNLAAGAIDPRLELRADADAEIVPIRWAIDCRPLALLE